MPPGHVISYPTNIFTQYMSFMWPLPWSTTFFANCTVICLHSDSWSASNPFADSIFIGNMTTSFWPSHTWNVSPELFVAEGWWFSTGLSQEKSSLSSIRRCKHEVTGVFSDLVYKICSVLLLRTLSDVSKPFTFWANTIFSLSCGQYQSRVFHQSRRLAPFMDFYVLIADMKRISQRILNYLGNFLSSRRNSWFSL